MSSETVSVRITLAIEYEYQARGLAGSDEFSGFPMTAGRFEVPVDVAALMFGDAEHNGHRYGPDYDIGTRSAYRALARQIGGVIGQTPDFDGRATA